MNDSAQVETLSSQEPRPRSKRAAAKRLSFAVGYICSVVSACLIMMWAVFNTWLNVLEYRRIYSEQPDLAGTQDWKMAAITIFFTCIVPFVFGLILLFRSLGSTKR